MDPRDLGNPNEGDENNPPGQGRDLRPPPARGGEPRQGLRRLRDLPGGAGRQPPPEQVVEQLVLPVDPPQGVPPPPGQVVEQPLGGAIPPVDEEEQVPEVHPLPPGQDEEQPLLVPERHEGPELNPDLNIVDEFHPDPLMGIPPQLLDRPRPGYEADNQILINYQGPGAGLQGGYHLVMDRYYHDHQRHENYGHQGEGYYNRGGEYRPSRGRFREDNPFYIRSRRSTPGGSERSPGGSSTTRRRPDRASRPKSRQSDSSPDSRGESIYRRRTPRDRCNDDDNRRGRRHSPPRNQRRRDRNDYPIPPIDGNYDSENDFDPNYAGNGLRGIGTHIANRHIDQVEPSVRGRFQALLTREIKVFCMKRHSWSAHWSHFRSKLFSSPVDDITAKELLFSKMEEETFRMIDDRFRPWTAPFCNMTLQKYANVLGEVFEPKSERESLRLEYVERVQKKDEHFEIYINSKYSLFRKAYEKNARSWADFYHACTAGLANAKIRKAMHEFVPDSGMSDYEAFDAYLNKAKAHGQALRRRFADGEISEAHLKGAEAYSVYKDKYKNLEKTDKREIHAIPTSKFSNASDQRTCWSCKQEGHFMRECPRLKVGLRTNEVQAKDSPDSEIDDQECKDMIANLDEKINELRLYRNNFRRRFNPRDSNKRTFNPNVKRFARSDKSKSRGKVIAQVCEGENGIEVISVESESESEQESESKDTSEESKPEVNALGIFCIEEKINAEPTRDEEKPRGFCRAKIFGRDILCGVLIDS